MFREQQDLTSVIFTEGDRKAKNHEDPKGGKRLGGRGWGSLRIREDIKGWPVRFSQPPFTNIPPFKGTPQVSNVCGRSRASCLTSLLSIANVPVGKALH